jgi:septal ring factor EnvC (AmiA/AmiB activator)
MNKILIFGLFNISILLSVLFIPTRLNARDKSGKCETNEECLQDITEAEKKLAIARKDKSTLTNEIKLINAQISVATSKIYQTENSIKFLEKEIKNISGSIDVIGKKLDVLAENYINQVKTNYINSKKYTSIQIFFSMDFNQILQIKKYITSIQEKTRNDLINYETTRTNLDTQKNEKIAKQEQLTNLQKDLKEQSQTLTVLKANKDVLLKSTMNDETKYQKLLQQAQSELESINAILSGKGSELKIKDVSKNEKIGTIIQGASCNSSGTHLHFIVKKGGATQNPLSFLKSNTDITNYSGDSSQASGDWSWPLSAPIKFNQGYGVTSSIKNSWVGKIYNFHNGIDISSSNTDVLSTTDGELYKGSYKGSGGCALKYTKVVDKTNNVETLYFHTN